MLVSRFAFAAPFAAALMLAACSPAQPVPAPAATQSTRPPGTAAPAAAPTPAAAAGAAPSPAAAASPSPEGTPGGITGGLPLPTPIPDRPSSIPNQALAGGNPYTVEQYLNSLKARGVTVKTSTREYRVPYFTVVGASFDADDEQVLLWTYNDAASREKDSAKITDEGRRVNGQEMPWRAKPHFFSRGNLIVQLNSDNDETAEKLKAALDALP